MSVHIVDDEQRSDRRATPMRPSGSGGAGAALGTRPLLILGQAPSAVIADCELWICTSPRGSYCFSRERPHVFGDLTPKLEYCPDLKREGYEDNGIYWIGHYGPTHGRG